MMASRQTAKIVGALFLIAMAASIGGMALILPVVEPPEKILGIGIRSTQVMVGGVLELVNCAAVIGIAVFMYPILKKQSEALAAGYVGFRVTESTVLALAVVAPLSVMALGQRMVKVSAEDAAFFQMAGALLIAARGHLQGLVFATFFAAGALLFYSGLYRARLVPRALSLWGLLAAILAFAGACLELAGLGSNMGMLLALPIVLNEITLGIWLIAKGFGAPVRG